MPPAFTIQGMVDVLTGKAVGALRDLSKEGEKSAGSIAASFTSLGASMLKLGTGIIGGAMAASFAYLTAQMFKFSQESQKALAQFQSDTGLSVAQMGRFETALANLSASNTQSLGELARTMQVVYREFGNLGDRTEEVNQDFLSFAKTTGTDAAEGVDSVKGVIDAYGLSLEHAAGLMDRFKVASQASGVKAKDLADVLSRGAPTFQALGLSIDESISLLATFADQGIGMEKTMAALLRIQDASNSATKEQAAAFKTLGVSVNEFNQPAGGAKAVLQSIITQMADGKLVGQEFAAVQTLLGNRITNDFTRGLKLGQKSLDEMTEKLDKSTGAVKRAEAAINKTFSERITLILNQHMNPAFGRMAGEIKKIEDSVLTLVDNALAILPNFLPAFQDVVVGLFNIIRGLAEGFVAAVKLGFATLASQATVLMDGIAKLPMLSEETRKGLQESSALLKTMTASAGVEGATGMVRATELDERGRAQLGRGVEAFATGQALSPDERSTQRGDKYRSLGRKVDDFFGKGDVTKDFKKEGVPTTGGDPVAQQKAIADAIKEQISAIETRVKLEEITARKGQQELEQVLKSAQARGASEETIRTIKEKAFDLGQKARQEELQAEQRAVNAVQQRLQLGELTLEQAQEELRIILQRQQADKQSLDFRLNLENQIANLKKQQKDKETADLEAEAERVNQARRDRNKDLMAADKEITEELYQMKHTALERELRDLDERALMYRAQGVEEGKIIEWLNGKRKAAIDEEMARRKGLDPNSPFNKGPMSVEDAFKTSFFNNPLTSTLGEPDVKVPASEFMSTIGQQVGKVEKPEIKQKVALEIGVGGKVEVVKGEVSETTLQGLFSDVGFESRLLGDLGG